MKQIFIYMFLGLLSHAHAATGDAKMCTTGGFLYNSFGYEETSKYVFFAMEGPNIGSAQFNRFEEITVDQGNAATILVAFMKTACTVDNTDEETITCSTKTNDPILDPKYFFVERKFRQFDGSLINVISSLSADAIDVKFLPSGTLSMTFTNANTNAEPDDAQTLIVDETRYCYAGPHHMFPENLKRFIEDDDF